MWPDFKNGQVKPQNCPLTAESSPFREIKDTCSLAHKQKHNINTLKEHKSFVDIQDIWSGNKLLFYVYQGENDEHFLVNFWFLF